MSLYLLMLTGCNGCQPEIPHPTDPIEDSGDSGDSGDDTAPIGDTDTGPPARCDYEEVEPNDASGQVLPMETWACGTFDDAIDPDWMTFTTIQGGWVEIDVEAASRGTSADAQMQIFSDEGSTLVGDGYLSSDPRLVFPAETPGTYDVILGETHNGYGEDYGWWMMATLVKAPIEWDAEEVEPNDASAQAMPFPIGQRVFGGIGEPGDFDWYVLNFPDGDATVLFDVQAYVHGSPANLKIEVYDTAGTLLRTDYSGEIEYDLDPWFEKRATMGTTWYVLLRTEDDRGGPFHWYTLSITSTPSG